MKRKLVMSLLFVASVVLAGCAASNQSSSQSSSGPPWNGTCHPSLSEQEKYIACSDCHQDATPEIYQQWYDSGHGIGMVKCYECHGTFENFQVVPDTANCAVCHSAQFNKTPAAAGQCWSCHPAHSFAMHK